EMVCVVAILAFVAAAALPLGVNAVRRTRELQLRRALTAMRGAIDEYHKYAERGAVKAWDPNWEMDPQDLGLLVEGVEVTQPNSPQPRTVSFLRKIPEDPLTGSKEWGLRSYQDDPDDTSWGGENVYDVYSLSAGIAMDGSPYSSW